MRSSLIPEVTEMIRSGRLSELDAEWIANLAPDNQLVAARKCAREFGVTPTILDHPRSPLRKRNKID